MLDEPVCALIELSRDSPPRCPSNESERVSSLNFRSISLRQRCPVRLNTNSSTVLEWTDEKDCSLALQTLSDAPAPIRPHVYGFISPSSRSEVKSAPILHLLVSIDSQESIRRHKVELVLLHGVLCAAYRRVDGHTQDIQSYLRSSEQAFPDLESAFRSSSSQSLLVPLCVVFRNTNILDVPPSL